MNINLINKILFVFVILGFLFIGYLLFNQNGNNTKTANDNKEINNSNSSQQIIEDNNISVDTADFETYKFKYTYTINIQGSLKSLDFKMQVPVNEEGKQYINITSVSEKPQKYYSTPNGQIAEYIFNDVTAGQKVITVEGNIKVRTYDIAAAEKYNKNISPETDLSAYLKSENLIETNDSYITDIANKISGNTEEEIIQNIYEYLQKNINYTIVRGNIGAKQALKRKQGKCSEYSAAMTALCRAKNIPARVVTGDIIREQDTPHAWVEVYFDKYGWVAVDPTHQGIHITEYMPDGSVKNRIEYNSKDTDTSYIALSRNNINYQPVSYTFYGNKQGSANLIKSLSIEKI